MDREDESIIRKQRLQQLRSKRRKLSERKDVKKECDETGAKPVEKPVEESTVAAELRQDKVDIERTVLGIERLVSSTETNYSKDPETVSNFKSDISSLIDRAKFDTDSAIHRILQSRRSN